MKLPDILYLVPAICFPLEAFARSYKYSTYYYYLKAENTLSETKYYAERSIIDLKDYLDDLCLCSKDHKRKFRSSNSNLYLAAKKINESNQQITEDIVDIKSDLQSLNNILKAQLSSS